jgi:thiamine pyrophosphokinase
MPAEGTMRRVIVITGHEPIEPPPPHDVEEAIAIVAADGGWRVARSIGLIPTHLVGDLDSLSDDDLRAAVASDCIVERHPQLKDASDGELAMDVAMRLGAQCITVCSSAGGRIDHELIELSMLADPRWTARIDALTPRGHVFVVTPDYPLHLDTQPGDTVSIMAIHGDASGVTENGLLFPLDDEPLRAGSSRGLSNVANGDHCSVSLRAGRLLAFHLPRKSSTQ